MKKAEQSETTKSPFSISYKNGWGDCCDEFSIFINKQKRDFIDIYDLLDELVRIRRVPYTIEKSLGH